MDIAATLSNLFGTPCTVYVLVKGDDGYELELSFSTHRAARQFMDTTALRWDTYTIEVA